MKSLEKYCIVTLIEHIWTIIAQLHNASLHAAQIQCIGPVWMLQQATRTMKYKYVLV